MNKYKVYGTYIATITKEVYANSEEEAREVAYDTFGGVTNLCGNFQQKATVTSNNTNIIIFIAVERINLSIISFYLINILYSN